MDKMTSDKELIVLLCAFLFSIHQMHGVVEARHRLTKDLGANDIYDCIDFYKQPAFDHPLLANHSFHPKMRPYPLQMRGLGANDVSTNDVEVEFKGVGCPVGTVPIRRVSENDRIRERLHVEKYHSKYKMLSFQHPGTHFALVRTKWNPENNKYYGGSAGFSLWNPSVEHPDQYSSGQIVLRNGDDNIQVGWTVNPNLYGDNRTRLFLYTGAGPTTQCFNTYCPGFVLVNNDMPVDLLMEPISIRGVITYSTSFRISKDLDSGNWWLWRGEDPAAIGFWPKSIFTTGLSESATSVEWGGQVSGPPNVPSAPMGSGESLTGDKLYDAYCSSVRVYNEFQEVINEIDVEIQGDGLHYRVVDVGQQEDEDFVHLAMYGGTGGILGD